MPGKLRMQRLRNCKHGERWKSAKSEKSAESQRNKHCKKSGKIENAEKLKSSTNAGRQKLNQC